MKHKFSKIICRPCYVVLFLPLLSILGLPNAKISAQSLSMPDSAKALSWKTVLASKDEPGEPLVVSGKVYAPDGKTPAPGITLYVYHTDAEGYYRKGSNSSSNPRLHGTMITNGEGKYEFRTIKPKNYPGGGVPAHIHYVLSGKGYSKQYDEVLFDGDPYITPKDRNSAGVRPLTHDKNGVWHCVYDVKLKQN